MWHAGELCACCSCMPAWFMNPSLGGQTTASADIARSLALAQVERTLATGYHVARRRRLLATEEGPGVACWEKRGTEMIDQINCLLQSEHVGA